ncbi:MAG TPA: SwmB domain-containing protein [Pseudonocardiaceae bacterium]|nr:SwmB domain-containing protein [Pseudonocardiaceae bacterium]
MSHGGGSGSGGIGSDCGGCGGGGGGGDDGGGGTSGGGGGTSGGGGGTSGGGGGSGSGGGIARLRLSGTCGDQLTMRIQQAGDPLNIDIVIPSADPSEVWTLTATEQDYNAVTGGRVGNPVDLIAGGILPPPAFTTTEGGFDTTGDFPDTPDLTHGFSYTATRTSPTPLTCTNQGFWTSPAGSQGPTAQNPTGRPDTAPALTGATEADSGTNDVAVQYDQELLATAQGVPAASRFAVTVDGVARTATGVTVADDSPPLQAVVDVTFDGAPLTSGQTVTIQYRQPLTSGTPALQDLESHPAPSFGPVSVPAF